LGRISGYYDTLKERIIISKRDFKITTDLGWGINFVTQEMLLFYLLNHNTNKKALNFQYLGIEKCKLKFSKTILGIK
jgi:hypothetical protein